MSWDEHYNNAPYNPQIQLDGLGLKGEQDVKDAIEWISDNPATWSALVSKAKYLASRQRRQNKEPRLSMRYLAEIARWEMGVPIKNAITPALSRIMENEHQELEGCFRKYRSNSDGFAL